MATLTVTPSTSAPNTVVDFASAGLAPKVRTRARWSDQTASSASGRASRAGTFAEQGIAVGSTAQVRTLLVEQQPVGTWVEVARTTVTVQKAAPPPPPPPPVTAGLYGAGIGMRSLSNTDVQGSRIAFDRFRAEQSSTLVSARVYLQSAQTPGYGAGTGGTARFTVRTDDGSADHYPTGTVLATATYVHPATGAGFLVAFLQPAALVAGTIYHLCCENTDASPTSNWFGLNYIWQNPVPSPHQPKYPDDWAWGHGYRGISDGKWVQRADHTPILDLAYGNGAHQGVGYMEIQYGGSAARVGGANVVRELFTPTADRTVTGAGVRFMRESGSDPLTIALCDAAGNVIDSFGIPATSIPSGTISANPTCGPAQYVRGSFASSRVLVGGTTYALRLSSAASVYWTCPIRKGVDYGYDAATYFADGQGQRSSGGSWSNLGQHDVPFYLL